MTFIDTFVTPVLDWLGAAFGFMGDVVTQILLQAIILMASLVVGVIVAGVMVRHLPRRHWNHAVVAVGAIGLVVYGLLLAYDLLAEQPTQGGWPLDLVGMFAYTVVIAVGVRDELHGSGKTEAGR